MNDRIRLALAMGWQRVGRTAETALYYPPGTKSYGPLGNDEPPDPFTDANDCEAVIRWLNEQKYDVQIWHSGTAHLHATNAVCRVKVTPTDKPWLTRFEGDAFDDWKQGVCELALKVLDNE